MMHTVISILALLFGLALVGAAISQVINYPQWSIFDGETYQDGSATAKWQRFFLYGLAPLFAGLFFIVYAVKHMVKRSEKKEAGALSGMADDSDGQ